jgi:hypothetical protein
LRETREQKIDRLETEAEIQMCELAEMEQAILKALPLAPYALDSQIKKMLSTWPPITEILPREKIDRYNAYLSDKCLHKLSGSPATKKVLLSSP